MFLQLKKKDFKCDFIYLMFSTGPSDRGADTTAEPVQEGQGHNDCSS